MKRHARKALGSCMLLGALLSTGCAAGQAESPFNPGLDGPAEILIIVRNLNFNEARLWAVSGGRRTRLGSVGGNQDAEYRIDWDFSQNLVLEIDLVAGPNCETRPLRVDPGDRIELQIESNFRLTRFCR